MRAALLFLVLLGAPVPAEESELSATITPAELTGHVRILASDALEGRRSGTPGGERAALYIARQFELAGLVPLGDEGTWLQGFHLPGGTPVAGKCSLKVNGADFAFGKTWQPFSFSAPASLAGADVVFAGYGIRAPEVGYDDYAGLDVKGKVVLLVRRGPKLEKPPSRAHLTFVAKARAAERAGAAAVILVNDTHHHPGRPDVCRPVAIPLGGASEIPFLFAKREVAAALFPELPRMEARIDETGKPQSRPLEGVKVDLGVVLEIRSTANVVGMVKGSDPALADEYVVVGGHYDHLGTDGGGALDPDAKGDRIWNGADDNASGTAGVIELAERFALSEPGPRRSIVFVAFAGEELGLLGSGHYVRHPPVPLERTVAMVNLDMIGRSDGKVSIGGVSSAQGLEEIVDQAIEGSGLTVRKLPTALAASDHASFARRRIPALFFFTGIHPDYHKVTDHWDRLEYGNAAKIVGVAAKIVASLADLPEAPAAAPYLGVNFDRRDKGPGVLVAAVVKGSPAAKAGLRKGDRLLTAGGKGMKGAMDLVRAIAARRAGQELELTVLRGEEKMTVTAVLEPRPF